MRRTPRKDCLNYASVALSRFTKEWLDNTSKATGKSRAWIIEDALLDSLPEEYMPAVGNSI